MIGEGALTEEAGLRKKQRHPEPTRRGGPGKAPTQETSEAAPFFTAHSVTQAPPRGQDSPQPWT